MKNIKKLIVIEGIIPVVVGLPLMHFSYLAAEENLAEEEKCEDVSGIWETTVKIDNSNCGFPNQTISFTYELIQNGCVLTVKGRGHKAVVKGDRIYWPGGTIPGRLAGRIYEAQTTNEKLKLIAAFGNYPWGPGEVFRYRTTDTFVLAIAMDRFIKSKEGPGADLWSFITREVLQPIGIARMPVLQTKELNGMQGIPKLGGGMLPNLDELAKLVKLLRNGGRHQGKQILSATKLDQAFGKARLPGLPTGWMIDDGETYYHMSLWLHPFKAQNGCLVRIPAMSGLGGTYVIIMPNGITAFRFADGRYKDPGTWDSSGLRKVADYIRPFCNKSIK
jgi:CubicO group peptidase (beta-lactamase class C family)